MRRDFQRWEFQKFVDSLLAQEKSSVALQRGESLRVVLAFPNTYELGMANLGYQTVYRLLNEQAGVRAERLFLYPEPWQTAAQTLESRWAPCDTDLFAFSVTYEMDYLNIFRLLHNADLPILSRDRTDDMPIVLAGGMVSFMNPAPFEPFFDCFALGEAEGIIPNLTALMQEAKMRGWPRSRILSMLAEQPYFFVPAFHRPAKRTCQVYRMPPEQHIPAASVIVTPAAHFGEMFLIEVGRGCGKRCLFCAASYLCQNYRPDNLSLLQQVIQERNVFGCKNIGLLGSAIGDLKQLPELCQWLQQQNYRLNFSSLRLDRLTPELLATAKASGLKSLTIAPEAGQEDLRRLVRKALPAEKVLQAARLLGEAGINQVKMYFILAFPFELETDTQAIAELVAHFIAEMKNAGSKKPILRVSANAFIPKPFTPLQWAPFANDKQIQDKRCELQQQLITFSGVQFTVKSSRAEKLQALLSQGDARIGESLYRAYEQKISPFRQLKKDGFKIAEWLDHEKEQDQLFPWDFLTYPIPRERLWRDYQAFRDGMMQRRVI